VIFAGWNKFQAIITGFEVVKKNDLEESPPITIAETDKTTTE
jgi:hypothetical protein